MDKVVMLRDINYINDLPQDEALRMYASKFNSNRWREFDIDFIKGYIAGASEVIKCVEIGYAEDWGCSDVFWENGFERIPSIPLSTSWATPAVKITFRDGDILFFSSYKEIKDSHWDSLVKGVSNVWEAIVNGVNKLLGMR